MDKVKIRRNLMMCLHIRLIIFFIAFLFSMISIRGETKETTILRNGPDPAFDDFERVTLGSKWKVYNGDVEIINNSDLGIVSKSKKMYGLGIITWNASNILPDQFSEAVLSLDKEPKALFQVFVRRRKKDGQRYGFHWNPANGGRLELKLDGAKAAPVIASVPAPNPAPGDTVRIEVEGNSIRCFHNSKNVINATDSTLNGPGHLGLALNVRRVKDFPAPFFESWRGGSFEPKTR